VSVLNQAGAVVPPTGTEPDAAKPRPGRGKKSAAPVTAKHLRSNRTAYLMIAPMVILLGIFVFWPLGNSVYLSLFKINFYQGSQFVGLQFYQYVLTEPRFWKSLWVGLYYAILTVPAGLIIALLLASFIKTLSKTAAAFMKTTVYVPAVVSTVVASVLFTFMYQDQGVVNWFLSLLNSGPIAWLNDPETALPAIAVPGLWLGFGITTLIMLAGLLDIPDSYYESADLDGAGYFKQTWYITIPLLKNVFLYLIVTGFSLSFQMIDLPLVMTKGGPVDATTTPNLYMFQTFTDMTPYATSFSLTAALLLFVVLGLISLGIFRLVNSDKAVDA
jgi:ABC-type sugar transport system permease subunit